MLADRLRTLREAKGYTQEEIADNLGETKLKIWRWENRKSVPDADDIARLAKLFGVSSDYLLGLSDDLMPGIRESDLSIREKAVVVAIRHGNPMEAIRVIVNE